VRAFLALLLRDLRLALRHGADTLLVVGFFFIAAILFPFAVGPDPALLGRIAAGIVWVMALLATLLSLERLFLADLEDGSLDLIALGPLPLELAVLAKAAAHWLASGVPLILATPVIAVLLGLEGEALPPLIAAMALGTPLLSLIGAVGAALSLGARRGGVLLSLLVLPLYMPALIFGAATVDAGLAGLPMQAPLLALAALLVAALPLAPLAAAAAIRQALE
jgi:heme exporter protein B